MTETGPLKCPYGPYPRSDASNFQKPTFITYYRMGRELSKTGLLYSKKQIKCIALHANYLVEPKLVTNGWCWDKTTGNVFHKQFSFMKQVTMKQGFNRV